MRKETTIALVLAALTVVVGGAWLWLDGASSTRPVDDTAWGLRRVGPDLMRMLLAGEDIASIDYAAYDEPAAAAVEEFAGSREVHADLRDAAIAACAGERAGWSRYDCVRGWFDDERDRRSVLVPYRQGAWFVFLVFVGVTAAAGRRAWTASRSTES